MIIDFRARPPIPEFLEYPTDLDSLATIGGRLGSEVPRSFTERSLDLWFEELQAAGIDKAVVPGYSSRFRAVPNKAIAELQRKFPDVVIGFGAVDPLSIEGDACEEIDRCVQELGLRGIYIEPGLALRTGIADRLREGVYLTDPRLMPVYQRCAELDVPLVVLTGPFAGRDMGYTSVTHLDIIAGMYPSLKLVCGHGCWPYAAEVIAVAYKRPNLYISPDQYMFMPGATPYVEAMQNVYLSQRILFATNYPFRQFADTRHYYEQLPVANEALVNVMGSNASRLLSA